MKLKTVFILTMMILLNLQAKGQGSGKSAVTSGATQDQDSDELEFLAVIKDENIKQKYPKEFAEAIIKLGELRSTAAIPDLVRLVTFTIPEKRAPTDKLKDSHPLGVDGRYPAIPALSRIGEPAVQQVVDLIENNGNDSLESKNAMWVLYFLTRVDHLKAVGWLQKRAETSQTPLGMERLMTAMNVVSGWPRSDER